jgi:hypothetical protein
MIATSWLAPDTWEENQEKAIREAVAAGPDWAEYLSLVDRHQITTLSWAALSRVPGITLPDPVKKQLHHLSNACQIGAIQQCMLLTEVLRAFNHAGIPVMPLKGPILARELYRDARLRHSLDLDLDVGKENIERAQTCLESKDWHLDSTFFPMTSRQWESFLQNEHHLIFVHSLTGCMLELHWRNHWETAEATSARWARSVLSVWRGCSIQTLSPGDITLYLCSHGGLHAWYRAKWLGDLARAHTLGRLDWEAAFDETQRSGQVNVVQAGIDLLSEVYGLSVPAMLRNAWPGRSSRLIRVPLQALKDPQEPAHHPGLASLRRSLRIGRYERRLWPGRTWRASLSALFHRREDFRVVPLPDALFWLYKPLRPVLWLWRLGRPSRCRALE